VARQAVVASQQLRLLPMSSSRALTLPRKSLFLNLSPHNSPCHRPATTRVFSRSQVPKQAFSHLTKFSSHHKGDTQPHRGSNLSSNNHGKPHSHRWTTSRETTTTHSSRTNTKVATATKVVCMVAIIQVRNFLFNFVSGYNQRPQPMGMPGQQPRGAFVPSQNQTTSSYTPKVTNAPPFVATTNNSFPAAASQTTATAAPLKVDLNLTASVFTPSSATTTFTPSTNQFPVA